MSFSKFCNLMIQYNEENLSKELFGYVLFTESSFDQKYSRESRTYKVSNDNKLFLHDQSSNSVYGDNLDNTDMYVELHNYLDKGCTVDLCYFLDEEGNEIWDYEKAKSIIGLD